MVSLYTGWIVQLAYTSFLGPLIIIPFTTYARGLMIVELRLVRKTYGKSRQINFLHTQNMPLGKAGVLLPLLKGVGRFARDQANNSPDTPYREVT